MKKNIILIIPLVIVDILIIKYLIYGHYPLTPSHAMYVILWWFYSFIINLIIACIVYFIKKYYTRFFVFNIFIFAVIAVLMFNIEVNKYMKERLDTWEFNVDGIRYDIGYSSNNADSTFDSIYRIHIKERDVEYSYKKGMGRGVVHLKNDTVYFLSIDSCQYYIYGDTLYNFEGIDRIKVKKVY